MATNTRLAPQGMSNAPLYGFSHAAVQNTARTLYIAGQIAFDENATLIGPGDLLAQTRQVLSNLNVVLRAGGCGPEDILHLRTYVVGSDTEKFRMVAAEIKAFYDDIAPAPSTYLGVSGLALPAFLVEIDATAAIPD